MCNLLHLMMNKLLILIFHRRDKGSKVPDKGTSPSVRAVPFSETLLRRKG